mgnify:CR=1 FL=1
MTSHLEVAPEFVTSGEPLREALQEVLADSFGVSGALVATSDGILVAAEFGPVPFGADGAAPDSVAALAAASSGIGAQFAHLLSLGGATATMVQGTTGCVAAHRVGPNAILVLFSNDGPNIGRLHLSVRRALPRVEAALTGVTPAAMQECGNDT